MAKIRAWFGRRNYWKIGFFLMLFLFECAREWIVITANEPASVGSIAYVGHVGDLVTATGRWKRIDHGSALEPSYVTIQCWRNEGKCIVASVMAHEKFVGMPDISRYDANFTDDAVTYNEDYPACVTYSVRIDLKLKKAFSTREKKEGVSTECAAFEQRIEMILGDSFEEYDATKVHFVPVLSALFLLLRT